MKKKAEEVEEATTKKRKDPSISDEAPQKKKKKRREDRASKANDASSSDEKQSQNSGKKVKKIVSSEKTDAPHQEEEESKEVWSKSKKKRMRKLRSKLNKDNSPELSAKDQPKTTIRDEAINNSSNKDKPTEEIKVRNGSSLQKSYAARLSGSRFRILNEELYTTTSTSAFERFQTNPELYDQYHEGFRHQVESWPLNPIDVIYRWITNKYSNQKDKIVVADFGCGDAELGKRLLKGNSSDKNKKKGDTTSPSFQIHSFDLVASSDLVTACDMANVPLKDKTVDVGIFCLALMGTNVSDFLREAHRVLKDTGRVKIAEVRSRFESTSGKVELDEFLKSLELLGFESVKVDRSNKMFVLMELKKNSKKPDKQVEVTVKPCIYKRR